MTCPETIFKSHSAFLDYFHRATADSLVITVKAATAPTDVEKGKNDPPTDSSGSDETIDGQNEEALQQISGSESVFTWEDVEYTVPYMGGQRKLLNKVSGYAKPGISE